MKQCHCRNTDGSRDYLTKGSKSEQDKYHTISLICGTQKLYKRTYLQNRNRLTDIEKKLWLPKGWGQQGRDKLGDWDQHIHTTVCKIDNQQRSAV